MTTQETRLAFAHPVDRASANAPDRDRIAVRDFILDADIGAFQAERGVTQRVQFDVVVEVAPAQGALADDVDRILSYDRITEAIELALSEERLNLLETLAERVAELILAHEQAERAFVRIAKLDRGPFTLGVEIVRTRAATEPAIEDAPPRPILLALGNAAIASPNLSRWLDSFTATGAPLLVAVGLPEGVPPRSAADLAQRRIDLLAIEQNAWVLAGRDRRCVVVGTRTELEWGLRHGQIGVWAPSKMVLDAVDAPALDPRNPRELLSWFAGDMNAVEIVRVGMDPIGANIPERELAL